MLEHVRTKFRLRLLPMWGQSEIDKGTITNQFPHTHDDLCKIFSDYGENFRLNNFVFKFRDGFKPDGVSFPLGEVQANYEKQKNVFWNQAMRESKGLRLVIPDTLMSDSHRVAQVQGFIEEDRTLGLWCMNTDGQILS